MRLSGDETLSKIGQEKLNKLANILRLPYSESVDDMFIYSYMPLNLKLKMAAKFSDIRIVEACLLEGADKVSKSAAKAAKRRNIEFVHYLIDNGAMNYEVILYSAIKGGDTHLVEYLRKKTNYNSQLCYVIAKAYYKNHLLSTFKEPLSINLDYYKEMAIPEHMLWYCVYLEIRKGLEPDQVILRVLIKLGLPLIQIKSDVLPVIYYSVKHNRWRDLYTVSNFPRKHITDLEFLAAMLRYEKYTEYLSFMEEIDSDISLTIRFFRKSRVVTNIRSYRFFLENQVLEEIDKSNLLDICIEKGSKKMFKEVLKLTGDSIAQNIKEIKPVNNEIIKVLIKKGYDITFAPIDYLIYVDFPVIRLLKSYGLLTGFMIQRLFRSHGLTPKLESYLNMT